MNKYFVQLADLDWVKVLGIGAALAVLYYFLLFDNGGNLESQIKTAKDQLASANTQLQQTQRAMEDANRFEKEVQATARQFEKITQYMPQTIGAAELTAIINQQAQASGVRPKIEPKGDDAPTGFYQTSKVELQLDGTFGQIVTFLSYLSRVPRLLTFDKVELKQPEGAGLLTFSGTLVAYRYLKDAPDPNAAKPAVGAK